MTRRESFDRRMTTRAVLEDIDRHHFRRSFENLLDWALGKRGSKSGNPYCIDEVREACKALGREL